MTFFRLSGKPVDTTVQPPPQNSPAIPVDRRSPGRQRSRGDRHRLSSQVIVNIVQAADWVWLLLAGVLAWSIPSPLHELPTEGSLLLATLAGSCVAAVFLARARTYQLATLQSLGKQMQMLPMPLLGGCCSMMVCLFLMREVGPGFRRWPFLWLIFSGVLLFASRCYLSRLIRQWMESGRLARRGAVIGAGGFSPEI